MEIKKHFNTFSEAIREGAKLRPQSFDDLFKGRGTPNLTSCALGAGYEAMFQESIGPDSAIYAFIVKAYPYLYTATLCPVEDCIDREGDIEDTIMCLNDDHEWTREQIADWLEKEEEKLGYVLLTEEPEACNTKDSVRSPELAGV